MYVHGEAELAGAQGDEMKEEVLELLVSVSDDNSTAAVSIDMRSFSRADAIELQTAQVCGLELDRDRAGTLLRLERGCHDLVHVVVERRRQSLQVLRCHVFLQQLFFGGEQDLAVERELLPL